MRNSLHRSISLVTVLALLAALAACGEDTDDAEPTDSGRTPEEVAALLVTPEALGDGWSVVEASGEFDFEGGIVTDENRDMLPRIELCATIESPPTTPSAIRWDAFQQFDFDTGMPTDVEPSPGTRPQHHLVFTQEFLLSDTESEVTAIFTDTADAIRACLDEEPTSTSDGETVETEEYDASQFGDEAVGTRIVVTEPGKGAAVWEGVTVIFRHDDLLVGATVFEITTPKITKAFDDAAIRNVIAEMEKALS